MGQGRPSGAVRALTLAEAFPATVVASRRGPLRPQTLAPVRSRMDGAALRRLFRLIDLTLVLGGAAGVAAWGGAAALWVQPLGAAAPVGAQALAALATLAALDGYRFGKREPKWLQPVRVASAAAAAFGVAAGLAAVLPAADMGEALRAAAVTAAVLAAAHGWAALRVRAWRRGGRLTPNVVVVGATADAGRLIARALETREVNVLGVFDDRLSRQGERAAKSVRGVPVLGDTSALLQHRLLPYVDRVVIAVSAASQGRTQALAERLRVLPNAVTLFVDVSGEAGRADALARLVDAPLTTAASAGSRAFAKRAQDIAIAGLACVVFAPVMALTALAVRLESPGPALFRQRREGFSNEPITVYKFRSMRIEAADATASRQVSAGDDRVTRVGRFIRGTSLDELPQLFNVLRGEMSLVGPRPHAIGMKTAGEDTRALVAEYAWRHRLKPGLTGWAQVNGSRGPVANAEDVRRRVALDLEYVERQSFWLDLWIMLLTVPRFLGDRGAVR